MPICIHYDGLDEKGKVKRKIVPKYEKWNYADTEELTETKTSQISNRIFNTVDENCLQYATLWALCQIGLSFPHYVITTNVFNLKTS